MYSPSLHWMRVRKSTEAMTEPRRAGSGWRARCAPAPICAHETRRVASRCGTTAVALAASKVSHSSLALSHISQLKTAVNARWEQRDAMLSRASSNRSTWLGGST